MSTPSPPSLLTYNIYIFVYYIFLQEVYSVLAMKARKLRLTQMKYWVDFPVHLTEQIGGLVEIWASGVSWKELCAESNLDEGDLCRLLRRKYQYQYIYVLLLTNQ